jgi:hypothetical protein
MKFCYPLLYSSNRVLYAFLNINSRFNKYQPLPPTNPLRPIILDNARPPRLTAAAGTKLAGASSLIKVIIFISEITLQPINKLLHSKIFCAFLIHAALLDQAFAHCPRFPTAGCKPGPCLSPSVADRPLRPAKDHRLGRLLPHQQPNPS